MVIISTDVDGQTKSFSMDKLLYEQLTMNVQPQVQKRDFDYLFIIDGEEGSGKSVFAMQLGKVLDPNLTINNIAFTPGEFTEYVTKSRKHQCIIFDEAFTGLSSRAAFSEINRLLVELMMEMRQRNLFVIIVMPTFFMLERYVALHRSKCLFHVYINKKGQRGHWTFYNKSYMKYIYINNKKGFTYPRKAAMRGTYPNFYTVNEEMYRQKKKEALKVKFKTVERSKYMRQRNKYIQILYQEFDLTQTAISDLSIKYGINITQKQISNILSESGKLGGTY